MLFSRFRKNKKDEDSPKPAEKKDEVKKMDDYLNKRDYVGAIILAEHDRKRAKSNEERQNLTLWIGYCYSHLAEFRKASEIYEFLIKEKNCQQDVYLYLGCMLFFMGSYEHARKMSEKGPKTSLQNRLLYHIALKENDQKKLLAHHTQLKDQVPEDQLCLAAIHYSRGHYQEAIEIYKKVQTKNKNYLALNVYLAFCYYKLDYFDTSLEVLQPYLDKNPDSVIATNLKACNHYRLYNFKAAESEMTALRNNLSSNFARDIIMHNTVVFRNGDGALQLLPSLVDSVSEARLNLTLYHLKKNDTDAAYSLMHHIEAKSICETLLKAITCYLKGIDEGSKELLKNATQYFEDVLNMVLKAVGNSKSERDTITGRQSMASAYFLERRYDCVLTYLNSILKYFPSDDIFNFNYGQAQLMEGNYEEAEKTLRSVKNHLLTSELSYRMCLARAYIAQKRGNDAWTSYQKERHLPNSHILLNLIANDCFKMSIFGTAAKAFDELEKREIWGNQGVGKRASCIGALKSFIAGDCKIEEFRDAVRILEHDLDPESQNIVTKIKKWASESNIYL